MRTTRPNWRSSIRYFREEMNLSSGGQDYADPSYKNEHGNAEWIHTVDSIVSSLIEARNERQKPRGWVSESARSTQK